MSFKDLIGVNANRKTFYRKIRRLGQANDFKYLDGQIDVVPNALETFDENRFGPVRESPAEPVFTSDCIPRPQSILPKFHPISGTPATPLFAAISMPRRD